MQIAKRLKQRILPCAIASALALGTLAGCATQPETGKQADARASTPIAGKSAEKQHYFLVKHENGRLYAFGDVKNYLLFLEHDEVPLTRTRIGGGPEGQTVIFGITGEEGKALDKPSSGEMFFDGKIGQVGPFYGEVVANGRYHVFGEWQDFRDYLAHKEIALAYTEIGVGPKGETVVYALNRKTKDQGRPVALIEAFKQLRQGR